MFYFVYKLVIVVSTLFDLFTFVSQIKIISIEAQIAIKNRMTNRFQESLDETIQQ